LGVTLNLIQQTLPLAFTTGMSFDMLLSSGAVNMWDHMSLIRGALQKKIMPPICRVMSISQVLLRDFKECGTSEEIARKAKKTKEQLSKEFVRVVKYGDEMPRWMEDPYVIYNERAKNPDERLNYHMPGGMTIKPDKDANSHFIPWWYVVVADVGAMYPTILKAMNVGADTVQLASKAEQPDAWIWLKKVPDRLLNSRDIQWRKITDEDSFADKGFMLGVKIDKRPGVVNCAMTGIMSMIAKTKKELKEVAETGNKEELKHLKMMYQSVKGARNAGTHGILAAPGVSGRQFNLWGAATITTKGQAILADTLNYLKDKGIRVVYGDTDGIYLGCSRSMGNVPEFSKSLGLSVSKDEKDWLTKPDVALNAIEECNNRWQKDLNYPDFELEPEIHDGMIFV
ncbi:MAG: DNA polymerase elongation subunit (family B), partial [Thermoplasmatales archaeon]|nr:DNA polymerase elongation subunit (family B) [Thermoplasmatales archaeon]